MTMFMETTEVSDTKTVAELQHLLATRGATSVSIEYSAGKIEGLYFMMLVGTEKVPFRLPCRWKAVETILRKERKMPKKGDSYEQWARRVAWRQIKRWVEAQLALIETGMVKTEEVFLPYAVVIGANGQTQSMFEMVEQRRLLTGPKESQGDS